MARGSISIVVAFLILIPAVGLGQQAPSQARHAPRAASAAPAEGSAPSAAPRSTPVPAPPALREGLARAFPAIPAAPKAIPTPPAGSWGVIASGTGGGGIFRDADSDAEAWLGSDGRGVQGYGSSAGGYFADSDDTGYAYAGYGTYGIQAYGSTAGGYFADTDSGAYAFVGNGGYGIAATGMSGGGYFHDGDGTSDAYLGSGDRGIEAHGVEAGGYFEDADDSGYAYVGFGNDGVRGYGTGVGGYFKDTDGSGLASVGAGDIGIEAHGDFVGGRFVDDDSSGWAHVAYGDHGIEAHGNAAGGYFEDVDSSGYAYVGYGNYGVRGSGTYVGGFFNDADDSGAAYLGDGDLGMAGVGTEAGGYFEDSNGSAYAYVGYGSYKIYGTGSVDFVQNHPYDPSSVIVYAAPEGDEVATYTRGIARLVNGEATVPLGATFKWVTNPDIGLTTFLTPTGGWCDLYLDGQTTESLTVRSRDGADCTFNYIVYGLRIGFEETSVVQEKKQEAYIPSMKDHRELYARRPDLQKYASLERFKGMRQAVTKSGEPDLSRANALRDAIVEFDPAVHELPMPPGHEEAAGDLAVRQRPLREPAGREPARRVGSGEGEVSADGQVAADNIPVDADGNVYASSFRPAARDLASLLAVSEAVEPGDVLVIDREQPGRMRLAREGSDPGVVGIVAAAAGLVLGAQQASAKPTADGRIGAAAPTQATPDATAPIEVPVAFSGVASCKVDASFGAIWPGDLLVTSPTPGRAMRQEAPLPGTVLGKALEPLAEGEGTIKVLVVLR